MTAPDDTASSTTSRPGASPDAMMRCTAILGLMLVVACGPGSPDNGTASTSSGTTTAPTTGDPVVTGTPSTSDALETTQPDATTTTTSPTTAEATATSTTGLEPCEDTMAATIDTEDWPGSPPQCVDPQVEWKSHHIDCRIDCSTMTQLHGEGPAAGLRPVMQIAFGVDYSACGSGLTLSRFYLGHPIKPLAIVNAYIECALDPWLGAHPVSGFLPDETPFEATMMIDSYAGDWLSEDPADPPRLLGSFSGDLVGPFEAIHCAAFDIYYDNCS